MTPPRTIRLRRAALVLWPMVSCLAAALLVLLPSPATASGGAIGPLDTASPSDSPTGTDSGSPSPSDSPTPTPRPSSVPPAPPPPHHSPTPQRPHPHRTPGSRAPKRPHPKRKASPVSVLLRTVPALPGVRFSVDGRIFTADADGTVTVTLPHDFTQHTLALLTPTLTTADRRYAFSRWEGQRDPEQAYRTVVTGLPWRAPYAITAAFAEQCPVTPDFVDQQGTGLDVSSLASASVRSDAGQISTLPVRGTSWLTCALPVYVGGSLVDRPLGYRLQSLIAGGTDIVDAGRQSFTPATDPRPTFVGLYFDLTVTAHDALFGGDVGRRAVLTGPDRRPYAIEFSAGHTATFAHLPRGDYSLTVTGGSGITLAKPIRLSRDTASDVTVISGADLGAATATGGVLALTLPLVARHRRQWLRRLVRPGSREATHP